MFEFWISNVSMVFGRNDFKYIVSIPTGRVSPREPYFATYCHNNFNVLRQSLVISLKLIGENVFDIMA